VRLRFLEPLVNDSEFCPFRARFIPPDRAGARRYRTQAEGVLGAVVHEALRIVRFGCALLLLLIVSTQPTLGETNTEKLARLRESADGGSSVAQYSLGLIYANTSEPGADPAEAYLWLSLAVRNGASDRALNNLLALASPEQIEEGKRRLARRLANVVETSATKVPPIKTNVSGAGEAQPSVEPLPTPRSARASRNVDQELIDLRFDKKQLGAELALARQETDAARKELEAKLEAMSQQIASREKELAELKARPQVEAPVAVVSAVQNSTASGDASVIISQLNEKLAKKEEEADLFRTRLLAATSVRSPVSPDGESNATAGQSSGRPKDEVAEQLRRSLAGATVEIAVLKTQLGSERASRATTVGGSRAETSENARLTSELETIREEFARLQAAREQAAQKDGLTIENLNQQLGGKDRALRDLESRVTKTSTGGTVPGSIVSAELAAKSQALQKAERAQEELASRLAAVASESGRAKEQLSEALRAREDDAQRAVDERARLLEKLNLERVTNERLRAESSTRTVSGQGSGGDLTSKLSQSEAERMQLAQRLAALSIETAGLKVQLATERGQRSAGGYETSSELDRTQRDLIQTSMELASQRSESSALAERVAQLTAERDQARKRPTNVADLTEAQERVETLERALAANETERRTLSKQIESERVSARDAAAQVAQFSTELSTLRKSMVSASELADAREELETVKRSLLVREIEEKTTSQRLAQEQRRAELGVAELAKLTSELEEARSRPSNQIEFENLKSAIAAGEREREELNRQLLAEQRRNATTSAQVGKLMADLDSSRTNSVSLEEFSRARDEAQSVKRSLVEAEAERATLTREVESERRGRVDAAIRVGNLAAELDTVRRENISSEELAQVRIEAENLKRALASSDGDRARLSQQFAAAKRSYSQQSQEFERAIKALTNLDAERASLANQLASNRSVSTSRTPSTGVSPSAELGSANNQVSAELALLREQLRLTQKQSEDLIRDVNQMKTRSTITPQGEIVLTSPPRPSTIQDDSETRARYHTVSEGESLSSLARRYYGSPNRWSEIEAANRGVIGNPNALRVGTRLRIP